MAADSLPTEPRAPAAAGPAMLAVSDLQRSGRLSKSLAVSTKSMAAQTTPARQPLHNEHNTLISTENVLLVCVQPACKQHNRQLAPSQLTLRPRTASNIAVPQPITITACCNFIQWTLCCGLPASHRLEDSCSDRSFEQRSMHGAHCEGAAGGRPWELPSLEFSLDSSMLSWRCTPSGGSTWGRRPPLRMNSMKSYLHPHK